MSDPTVFVAKCTRCGGKGVVWMFNKWRSECGLCNGTGKVTLRPKPRLRKP